MVKNSKQPTISICTIVKNEARAMHGFLENIKDFADEIIIVDTGSGDNTIEIVNEIGIKKYNLPIKIYHYEYTGNFHYVVAKNFSISKGTKDYIFVLDADERISEEFKNTFGDFLIKEKPFVATIKRVDEPITQSIEYPTRIIKNHLNLFYKIDENQRVHEELLSNYEKKSFLPTLWHCQRENHWIHTPQRIFFQLQLAIDVKEKDASFFRYFLRGIRSFLFKFNKVYFKKKVYKNGFLGFKYAFMRGLESFLINFFTGLKPKNGYKYWEDKKHRYWNSE